MRYSHTESKLRHVLTATLLAAIVAIGVFPTPVIAQSPASSSQPAVASGPVLYVNKQPDAPYTTVQSAIDAAPENAVIHIAAGTYDETLSIHRPLILEGDGWNQTIITPHLATADDIFKVTGDIRNVNNGERKKIYDAALKGLPTAGVTIDAAAHVELRHLQITSPPGSRNETYYQPSLLHLDNTHISIRNCALVGSSGDIVSVANGTVADFHDSLIAASWGTGVNIGDHVGRAVRVTVSDCDIRNNYYAGITIAPSEEVTVDRCRISGAAWHGIRYDDVSPTITNSRIFNNARSGIYASGRTKATITNNLFAGNEMDGISCWFGNVDTISHNTFAKNLREAISILGNSEPTIDHNLFFGNPSAVDCSMIANSTQGVGSPKLGTNLFWKNENIKRIKMEPDPNEGDAVQVDPLFTKPDADDFSLPTISPAAQQSLGVSNPLSANSPFPLQPQEQSIIPSGASRDYKLWKSAP